MADELNVPTHRWYQARNHIKLPPNAVSKKWIYANGVALIDAWINSQPWGNPVPALFAAGEPGAWYDPSDLSTMFQDSAGTTPVTAAGQPVGLRLDKSKGLVLGSELVTNGDFSAGSTGWTAAASATLSVSGGSLVVTNGAAEFGYAYQLVNTVVGKTYTLTFTVTGGTSSGSLYVGTTLGGFENYNSPPRTVGVYTVSFLATATTTSIRFGPVSNTISATFALDNISVKELPGNHAVANPDAARGIYGIEPLGGRRNLLTYTEQFDNAVWGRFGSPSVSAGTGFFTVSDAQTGATSFIRQAITLSGVHTASVVVRKQSGSGQTSRLALGDFTALGINFNAATGVFSHNATSGNMVSISDTEWIVTVSGTMAGNFLSIVPAFRPAGEESTHAPNNSATGSIDVVNAQLETGSTATPYQRVVSQYEVTEAGKPTLHYVQYDGVDDSYVTPTITPGTDKVQVFAGVRKLSDAAIGVVLESSVSAPINSGTLSVRAPQNTGTNTLVLGSRGTITAEALASGFSAPTTNVIAGLGDISGDLATLRVNGTQAAQSTADQGTGNYLAYPLYIGRRGGTSLPFNGRDYGLIARFGPNLSTAQIASVEGWLNTRTGAY